MGRSTFENCAVNSPATNNDGSGVGSMMVQQSDHFRTVMLHTDVDEHSISIVIAQLLHLANLNHQPINLVVSTYGGSIDEMFSLYDTIKFLPCPVHTVGLGKIMSAGVLLLASGEKGKRMIGRSARIMMHPVSGGRYGTVFDIENESKECTRLHDLMVTSLESESNLKRDAIEKIMKTGYDYYITAQEAIKFGIVDKIIGDK